MVNFGEYENSVRFSNAAADDFIDLLHKAVAFLFNFESTRVGAESLASTSFAGYFSTVFAHNMRVCSYDGQALREALTKIASQVEYVKEQAAKENQRRRLVREYFARHDNWWEKGWDWLVGQEEPPHLPPADPPVLSITASVANNRQQELGKGPAGGVSSAIPENLLSASSNLREASTNLIRGSVLANCYEAFTDQCRYGLIQVNDVFHQLDRWISLNENDVNWLRVVGEAFASAGSGSGIASLSDQAISQVLQSHNVDCVREDLDISSPTMAGIDPKTGYIEDPVNSATGNFVEPELDLSFVGSAAGLGLSRLYNSVGSLNGRGGVFGPGWSSVLDQCLELDGDGCVGWLMADGRLVPFGVVEDSPVRAVRDSFWVCRTGIDRVRNGWLMDRIANIVGVDAIVWLVSDNAGGQWYFTETGMWLGESRGAGSGLFVDRDDAGFVVGILSERGRSMKISYTSDGLVERVGSDDGREVCYVYDAQSRLVRVDGLSGSREYVWDGLLITQVVDAAGVVECVNVYDNKGRVTSQVTEFGRRVKYVYLPGNITVVSDGDGGRANTWIANAYGHTVGVIDSDDQRQSMSYDRWGNLVMVRDRDGNQRVRLYDERSRMVRDVLPSKAYVSYQWDEFDRIVEVSNSVGGTVSYEYADDTCLNPCRIVDPLGGVSELVWRDGLLVSVVDPEGVRIGFDYDAHGDLISVVNGQGAVASMERDAVGHVVKTISPLGFVTEFSYSPAGLLEKIVDAEGGVWTYHYDKAGRLVKNTDPTGVVQSFEYGPHGKLVKAIDGLGRATVQEFDDLGNVQAIKLPDGAEYAFTYDGLSRLKSFTDPSGSSWTYQWDKLGNFAGVVDPEGVKATVTGSPIIGRIASYDSSGKTDGVVEFDEFGRPVKTVDMSGDAEIVTYNRAGQPVEFLDADGGLTILTRDLAGRVVAHASAQGLVTSYTYDVCGRLATVIAPNGGIYRCEYDADSRLIKVINPVGDESSYVYDKVGRLVKAVVPGQGVVERKYDKAGRLIFTRDSLGGPRWFTYDKAGQLIKAINGLGGASRYEYDAVGRLVRMVNPAGGIHTYAYDQAGNLIQVVDPLGNTTRAEYDKAGRVHAMVDAQGTSFTYAYDTNGRLSEAYANGRLLFKVETDMLSRTITLFDYTNAESSDPLTHTLVYTRLGQLASKTTFSNDGGRRKAEWFYNKDGQRVKYVSELGIETRYEYDVSRQLASIDHPLLGQAFFSYDKAGNLTHIKAGDSSHEWVWDNGFVTKHATEKPGEAQDVTLIGRDAFGRVASVKTVSEMIEYSYDEANQLTSMRTSSGQSRRWIYDKSGRLTTSTYRSGSEAVSEFFTYNQASQLTYTTTTVGSNDGVGAVETVYTYNKIGQRTSQENSLGQSTTYTWGLNGFLESVNFTGPDMLADTKRLIVDALGYLTGINDASIEWDYASVMPAVTGIGLDPVLSLPGGQYLTPDSTSLKSEYQEAHGWRPNASTSVLNPYTFTGASPEYLTGLLPDGVSLAGASLSINGLDWMGARIYDSATVSFLSQDPLSAPAGVVWETSPYNYAANNPLNLSDPYGLKPVTDQQMQAYSQTIDQRSFFTRAKENFWSWNTLAGLGLMVAGGVIMFTGIGGPAGAALFGAGVDATFQQLNGGTVDWISVGITTLVGTGVGAGMKFLSPLIAKTSLNAGSQKLFQNLGENGRKLLQKPIVYGSKFLKESAEDVVSTVVEKPIKDAFGIQTGSFGEEVKGALFSPTALITRSGVVGIETRGMNRYGPLYGLSPYSFNNAVEDKIDDFIRKPNFGYDPRTSTLAPDSIYALGEDYLHTGSVKSVNVDKWEKGREIVTFSYQASPDSPVISRDVRNIDLPFGVFHGE